MNRQNFENIITAKLELYRSDLARFERLLTILREKEGKPLDGRNFNKKFLNAHGLILKLEDLSSTIIFEGHTFYLPSKYKEIVVYSEKEFKARGGYETGLPNTIKELEEMDKEKVFARFNEIDEAYNKIKSLMRGLEGEGMNSYNLPIYYDLLKEIEGEDTRENFLNKLSY